MFRFSGNSWHVAMFFVPGLASCGGKSAQSGSDSNRQAIALSAAAMGSTVDANLGQEIDITLQTLGPGEYATPSMSSDSVQFLEVTTPAARNPGGPTQEFRFEAELPGTAVITIPNTAKSQPFDVTITVQ